MGLRRTPTPAEVELTNEIEKLRCRRAALDVRARSAAAFLDELMRRKADQRTVLRQQMRPKGWGRAAR